MGNGCGPSWLNEKIKALLFNWFYYASCNKHDSGYEKGGDWKRRMECDVKFLIAMFHDFLRVKFYYKPVAFLMMISFFVIVRLFGWSRFNYK